MRSPIFHESQAVRIVGRTKALVPFLRPLFFWKVAGNLLLALCVPCFLGGSHIACLDARSWAAFLGCNRPQTPEDASPCPYCNSNQRKRRKHLKRSRRNFAKLCHFSPGETARWPILAFPNRLGMPGAPFLSAAFGGQDGRKWIMCRRLKPARILFSVHPGLTARPERSRRVLG